MVVTVLAEKEAVTVGIESIRGTGIKRLLEGNQLLPTVPLSPSVGRGPVVSLEHGLVLDDEHCWQSPTLILGNVGSGKTTFLMKCMAPLLEYASHTGDNAVIFCAKPELLAFARPGDPIIEITSQSSDCCWNLFRELDASNNSSLTLREITAALFQEAEAKTMQPFFPQAARDILEHTCLYLYHFSKQSGLAVSNADLITFLETTPIQGDDSIPGWMELAQSHPEYFGMVRDYIGNGNDQGLGVLSELRTLINRTLYGSFASNQGTFSAIRAIKQGGVRIFLRYDYANAGRSALAVIHVLLDLMLKQAMQSDSSHKNWFFLDEASLLAKSDVLCDALNFARDPGCNGTSGVRILMALQSARLMMRHYTQEEGQCLLSSFPNVIAFRVADPMSRAVVSERYGKAHYQYCYTGTGTKTYNSDSYEPVVSDYHFSLLTKKGQAIISIPELSPSPFFYDGYQEGDST